jgi:hypothetical protein
MKASLRIDMGIPASLCALLLASLFAGPDVAQPPARRIRNAPAVGCLPANAIAMGPIRLGTPEHEALARPEPAPESTRVIVDRDQTGRLLRRRDTYTSYVVEVARGMIDRVHARRRDARGPLGIRLGMDSAAVQSSLHTAGIEIGRPWPDTLFIPGCASAERLWTRIAFSASDHHVTALSLLVDRP